MNRRAVLVTGASGFIGSHLMRELEAIGYVPTAFKGRLDGDVDWPQGHEVVVHLAGRGYVPDSWVDPLPFYETNVLGTARVLEYCRSNGARLIYISSYVYGTPLSLPIGEDHPIDAASPYAHGKILAEDCCQFYAKVHGLNVLTVRPFNIYGPGQDQRFLIPHLIDALLDPDIQQIEVADDEPRRDFLYVDDLVKLLIRAVESDLQGPVNAGSGQSHSVREVHDLLAALSGVAKPLTSRRQRRPGEVMNVVADIGRAADKLGWYPQVTLADGLARTLRSRQLLT